MLFLSLFSCNFDEEKESQVFRDFLLYMLGYTKWEDLSLIFLRNVSSALKVLHDFLSIWKMTSTFSFLLFIFRCKERRSSRHLHADDLWTCCGHAGLCTTWSHPFNSGLCLIYLLYLITQLFKTILKLEIWIFDGSSWDLKLHRACRGN